jgi:hypothetical protein
MSSDTLAETVRRFCLYTSDMRLQCGCRLGDTGHFQELARAARAHALKQPAPIHELSPECIAKISDDANWEKHGGHRE